MGMRVGDEKPNRGLTICTGCIHKEALVHRLPEDVTLGYVPLGFPQAGKIRGIKKP